MYASRYNCQSIVDLLIDYNAKLNNQDKEGRTALYHACKNGNYEIAEKLIKNGADLNIKTNNDWTAFHIAC